MNVFTAAIAISLAFDCFSVAIGSGTLREKFNTPASLRMASSFGLFQGGMLLAGWNLGTKLVNIIGEFDHWVAFLILLAIGVHMIYEATKLCKEENRSSLAWPVLITLSIATSIDALAAGFSLPLMGEGILMAALTAGFASFILTIAGNYIGSRSRSTVGKKAEAFGGAVLIMIGFKILLEHLLS